MLYLSLILCLKIHFTVQEISPHAEKLILQNNCVSKTTCHDCIQTPTCAWCFQPDFSTDKKRCFQPSSLNALNPICADEYTWNPGNEIRVLLQRELTRARSSVISGHGAEYWSQHESYKSSSKSYKSKNNYKKTYSKHEYYQQSDNIVQVTPQRLSLKLRVKESYRFQMHYTQAEDYPVDLYYLMDLSKSMEDDKDKLSMLGDLLAESMRNITSNFRLGFGSFVDKIVMPYVSTVPKQLKEPCIGCAAPYGFKNVMSLSQNTEKFSKMVKEASVSGNLDAPEGGFDAIMQAVVCRNEIGWREKARRLLVLSTDAGFHYAGDGKLGGIVTPNDGHCHLDSNGMYTHSTALDYPSISQINLKVKENAINVIFAVTEEKIKVYKQLQNHIEGASCGKLSKDSSNVVDLVKEQYQQISSSVELKDNSSSALRVSYYSQCLDSSSPLKQTSRCENIKVGDVITFTVDIEVLNCPKDPKDWKQILQIYPVGLNESLLIDLEIFCDCPCERSENKGYIKHAMECSGHGTLKCGICECDPFHFGRKCECSTTYGTDKESGQGCRPDNTTLVDCSGRGNCVCGQCECETRANEEEVISGNYCECDNFSCDRRSGLLCSGPDHGTCVCGQCQCNPLFGGSACDCLISNQTCIAPGSNDICSGHGQCICGQCKCDQTDEGKYTGMFCDKCPTCPGRCQEFKECVQCLMYKTGPLKNDDDCSTNCTIVPVPVDQVEVDEEKGESLCAYYDEDDCRFAYVYTYDEHNKVIIRAQKERECPPKVFMLGFVLFVVAGVVIVGMAVLLLWKVLTTIHDRREFARFEKERMMAKWDTGENPIYKQATTTFKNPTYCGKL